MSSKSARREYLQALADFDRACVEFSKGMRTVLEPPAPTENTAQPLLADLGPRKPAKRAQRVPLTPAKRAL
ncbi:hypothetical protein [Variovorax sp. GT1P44]|uniref:hypothetical protein n=1 Tax=Variovorax sp. GT1P44 TaxID=3443742 RepID=UPI003F44B764